jgi:cytochrome c oxidase subunit 2
MPIWSRLSFQNRNSPLIEHLIFFHDHSIIILVRVTIITLHLILSSIIGKSFNRFFLEAQEIELFWTTLPALILIFIAIPSLKTLYIIEETITPNITIKTIGHQWYWSYEYSDFKQLKYDSFIVKNKLFRLIDTSNHLVIPIKTPTRILASSTDVIHSWTIPTLGVKIDATPGRINQITILSNRPGVIVGQCSEICGTNHRFIPITLERVSHKNFIKTLNSN